MRIGLFTSKKSVVNVVPLVAEKLVSKVKGIEISEFVADNNLDLVKDVLHSKKIDLSVVIVFYEEDSPDVKVLMEKMVEADLGGKKIMKFFEKGLDFDEEDEADSIVEDIMQKFFIEKKEDKTESRDYDSFTSL